MQITMSDFQDGEIRSKAQVSKSEHKSDYNAVSISNTAVKVSSIKSSSYYEQTGSKQGQGIYGYMHASYMGICM